MNRRAFLAVIIGSFPVISGCSANIPSNNSNSNKSNLDPKNDTTTTNSEPANAPSSTAPNTEKLTTSPTADEISSSTPVSTGIFNQNISDVKIHNETNSILTTTVTINRIPGTPIDWSSVGTDNRNYSSSEQTLSETFELPPSSPPEYKSKIYQNSFNPKHSYSIKIAVHDESTNTYYLRYGFDNTGGLIINIKKNSIKFVETAA